MTSSPTPQTAAQLLQRVREQVLSLLCVGYLLYLVLALFGVHSQTQVPEETQWVSVGVMLLALGLTQLGALRYRWVSITVAGLVSLIWLLEASQLLQTHSPPAESLLWLALILLVNFVILGSAIGAVVSLVLMGGLAALFLLYPPGVSGAIWLNGGLILVAIALIGFLLMQFIERNINLHEQASDQLKAARLDSLTGIYGRAAAESELRRSIDHALKSSTPLSVIVTDIDRFKLVNDQHGHGAGDDVLRAFAKRLRRNVGGSGGIVGRWGGEEFIIILPAVARPDAIALAERLRQEVSFNPIAGMPITASFGVASYRGQGDDLDQLFGRADERLYEAKNSGRNAVRG